MKHWTTVAGVVVIAAAAVARVVVSGQARDPIVRVPEPQRVTVINKPADAVPVTAVITRMPSVKVEPGALVELGPDTMLALKAEQVVRIARVEWEYRELRVQTAPASYSSVLAPLRQAGSEGWETTGLSFSDSGATVIILKRQR